MGSKASRGIRSNIRTFALQKNLAGISQNRDERFLNPTEAEDIINMHSLKDGTWSADKAGYSHVNGTAAESGAVIDGVHWFTDAAGVDYLLVAANGKLKQVNIGTGVVTDADASAGYTAGDPVDFQNFQGLVFTCDGNIATPRTWDGTTAADAGGWPVTGDGNTYTAPKFVEQHQNRLSFSGFADYRNHLVISDQNNGEAFTFPATTAANAFITEIGPGVGGYISGKRSLPVPNSNEDALVVYKDSAVYTVFGSSGYVGDADKFRVVRNNTHYGAFNNRCIVQVGADLLAINVHGISSYTSASASGTIQPVGVNVNRVRDVIERVNLSAVDKCWAIHLPDRREVWFGLPTGSSSVANEFIIYKYPDPGEPESLPKWSRRTGFVATHGALYNKTFYIGTNAGFIGHMFNSSKYNTTGINWKYDYPYWDVGNELQFKRILHGESHWRIRGNQTVTIRSQWKGGGNNDEFSDDYSLETTVSGAVYGTAVYGTDRYGDREEVTREYYVPGNGKRVKHTLSGTTTSSGPEFLGLSVKAEMGGLSSHWN
jgi:hypothetical protein